MQTVHLLVAVATTSLLSPPPAAVTCLLSPLTNRQRGRDVVAAAVGEDSDSQLRRAMAGMNDDERANMLLQSLLSSSGSEDRAQIYAVVDDMSADGIALNEGSLTALIDTALDGLVDPILESLLAAKRNGVLPAFGSPLWGVAGRPSDDELAVLPRLPSEDSIFTDASVAAAAGVLATGAVAAHPPAALLLPALTSSWAVDRYTSGGKLFAQLSRGFERFALPKELSRECATESASFLVGYLLGLPCCALAPTAETALAMLASPSSGALTRAVDPQCRGSARLVDRTLIWILAPLAIEVAYETAAATTSTTSVSPDVVASPSLSEAREFLQAARRREMALGVEVDEGGWQPGDPAVAEDVRLRWAYAEARRLLARFSGLRNSVQESMMRGVSFGACVALVEGSVRGQIAELASDAPAPREISPASGAQSDPPASKQLTQGAILEAEQKVQALEARVAALKARRGRGRSES